MRNPFLIAALAALTLLAVFLAVQQSGQVRVIDGDTIDVEGVRVRIHGIDAPEAKQSCRRANGAWACGRDASSYMRELVQGEKVSCEALDKDRYGRTIGRCWANGADIGAAMVSAGYALAYRRYSKDYVPQEGAAKGSKAGIWAGEFVPPWDWRKGVRLSGSR